MYSLKPLPEFSAWLDGLADTTVRGAIVVRGSKRARKADIKRAKRLVSFFE